MNYNFFPPPLLPVVTPSTTPPKALVSQRPLACKLSLSIPTTPTLSTPSISVSDDGNATASTLNCGQTPAPLKIASTPLRLSRPKLALNVSTSNASQTKPSLSLTTSIIPPFRQPTPEVDEEDVTMRNTIANQRLTAADSFIGLSNMDIDEFRPSYTFEPTPGVKPILKRGIRSGSTSSASSASSVHTMDYSMSSSISSVSSTFSLSSKSVSFDMCPSYIPRPYTEDDEELLFDDVENMSPPSTTSSTDSEESESDNEVKTPVDTTQSGWMTRKFANKPGFGGGGRWKKAKREWVWTLGDFNADVEQHHHQPQEMGYNGEGAKFWVAV